ncbi:Guanine nucleotide-binding protein G(q) subunit alpha [Aphelenchoides avenae]|nr:Guanine nucleotide-binding protein G(q) subunit alpha [Aphelenchus avenae]
MSSAGDILVDPCCALIPVVKLADKVGLYDSEQAAMNRAIERHIKRDKMRRLGEWKLLLLGPGESGKSTFLKQMRIIHGAGYSEKDRLQFLGTVFRNVYAIMQSLIHAMELLEIDYADARSQVVPCDIF